MTLTGAYLALGRQITDLANSGTIDGDRSLYYRRAGLARSVLRAAAEDRQDDASRLGCLLSTPIFSGPAAGKDWRPVAELAWKLGRQVLRAGAQAAQQRAA